MRFDLITLFPGIFDSFLAESIIGKALEKEIFQVRVVDIRSFTTDKHHTADDRPFGGGPGMVLKAAPVAAAIKDSKRTAPPGRTRVILMTPGGNPLTQRRVEELAEYDHLVLICGRYEGIDERVSRMYVDEEISVGDYVLAGGDVPAMLMVEAVARLLPGVLGKMESTEEETFQNGLLEYPHYTRPRVFEGEAVPDVLLSGDHETIRKWRLEQSVRRTLARRPDILDRNEQSDEVEKILEKIHAESDEKMGN